MNDVATGRASGVQQPVSALSLVEIMGLTACTDGAGLAAGDSPPPTTVPPTQLRADATAAGGEAEADPLADAPLGQPGCDPASPVATSSTGFAESRLTSDGVEAWALLWDLPPWPAGKEVKVVRRVAGSGDFDAVAIGPERQRLEPSWGPRAHGGSNWDRPGAEWGTGFTLETPGCWELRVTRDEGTASLWIEVREQ